MHTAMTLMNEHDLPDEEEDSDDEVALVFFRQRIEKLRRQVAHRTTNRRAGGQTGGRRTPRNEELDGEAKWRRLSTSYMEFLGDSISEAKKDLFRRYFRVPYTVYLKILHAAEESGRWPSSSSPRRGGSVIPLKQKIMAALRVAALGVVMGGVSLESGIAESTLRTFVPQFFRFVVQRFSDEFIQGWQDSEVLAESETTYAARGCPGAVGSMDGVHVKFSACPAEMSASCTGKEKVPTVAPARFVARRRP